MARKRNEMMSLLGKGSDDYGADAGKEEDETEGPDETSEISEGTKAAYHSFAKAHGLTPSDEGMKHLSSFVKMAGSAGRKGGESDNDGDEY